MVLAYTIESLPFACLQDIFQVDGIIVEVIRRTLPLNNLQERNIVEKHSGTSCIMLKALERHTLLPKGQLLGP